MKHKLIFAGIALLATSAFGLQGCDKAKEVAQANIGLTQDGVHFDIPPISTTTEGQLAAMNVHLNIDSFIHNQNSGFSAGNIKSVKITGCHVIIDSTSGAHFDNWRNLESASATFHTNINTTDLTLGQITSNPDVDADYLDIPVNSTELKDYFNATDFSYMLRGKARAVTQDTLHCTATFGYSITVGL